jgi:hypothetical protein
VSIEAGDGQRGCRDSPEGAGHDFSYRVTLDLPRYPVVRETVRGIEAVPLACRSSRPALSCPAVEVIAATKRAPSMQSQRDLLRSTPVDRAGDDRRQHHQAGSSHEGMLAATRHRSTL